MSWSIPTMKKASVPAAREMVEKMTAPQSVKDYVNLGIDGLVKCYGDEVLVSVDGHGHVCEGPGSYDVTTASITVRRE